MWPIKWNRGFLSANRCELTTLDGSLPTARSYASAQAALPSTSYPDAMLVSVPASRAAS
jgi:hypothetical protein